MSTFGGSNTFGSSNAQQQQQPTGTLFGNTQNQGTTNPLQPQATQSNLFGGNTGSNLFGSSTTNTNTNANQGQTGGLFGGGQTGGGLFGNTGNQQQQQQPAATGGLFGNTQQQQQQPATGGTGPFGSSTTQPAAGTGLFGSSTTQQGGGLFGSIAQNQPAGTSNLFGSTNNQTQQTGTGLFGSNTNQTQQTGTGLFGSSTNQTQQPSTGLFGSSTNQTQQPGTGLFGSNTNQQSGNTGGLFGNNQQQQGNTGAGLFGSTAGTGGKPAGALFGNTGGSSFGGQQQQQPQQQQQQGSFFGSTNQQQPATGGGLWGSSNQQQPTTGGGLFGSTNQQRSGGFLGTSTLGTSALGQPSGLGASTLPPGTLLTTRSGAATTQKQEDPQVQALKLQQQIEGIYNAWNPANPQCQFQHPFYNLVDPAQINLYGRPLNSLNNAVWDKAVKENPDPSCLVPVIAIGFDDLRERVEAQSRQADTHHQKIKDLKARIENLKTQHAVSNASRIQRAHAQQVQLMQRLVSFVQHLHLLIPAIRSSSIRPEEEELRGKLEEIEDDVKRGRVKGKLNELWALLGAVNASIERRGTGAGWEWAVVDEEGLAQISQILGEQQIGLAHLTKIIQKDMKDLGVVMGNSSSLSAEELHGDPDLWSSTSTLRASALR